MARIIYNKLNIIYLCQSNKRICLVPTLDRQLVSWLPSGTLGAPSDFSSRREVGEREKARVSNRFKGVASFKDAIQPNTRGWEGQRPSSTHQGRMGERGMRESYRPGEGRCSEGIENVIAGAPDSRWHVIGLATHTSHAVVQPVARHRTGQTHVTSSSPAGGTSQNWPNTRHMQ